MKLDATMARRLVAIAVVAAIVGLVAWRELGDDAGGSDTLGVAEGALTVEVGEPAPDFALAAPDGEVMRLSDFRGQTVVLNFWATWCGPCRAEMPELQRVYEERSAAGDLVVLAVNVQESAGAVEAFFEEFELTFPTVLDAQGEVTEEYGLLGLPGTFFIDADGVLRSRVLGPVLGDLLATGVAAADAAGA